MATAGDRRGPGPERAYVPDLPESGRLVLDPRESHHLVRVRRQVEGTVVVVFDGEGGTRAATLLEADARAAVLEVGGAYPDREPPRPLTLAVSLPDPARADGMVATLAELGVSRLLPLECGRGESRRGARLAERRRDRWQRLAVEAAKVNGRSRLLEILGPRTPAQAVEEAPAGAVLLDPDPGAVPLASALPDGGPLPWILVGPAGGFTDEEIARALRAGAVVARLGVVALRTETAAAAAAALVLAR